MLAGETRPPAWRPAWSPDATIERPLADGPIVGGQPFQAGDRSLDGIQLVTDGLALGGVAGLMHHGHAACADPAGAEPALPVPGLALLQGQLPGQGSPRRA